MFTVFIILTPLMAVSAFLSLKLAKHIERSEKEKKKKGMFLICTFLRFFTPSSNNNERSEAGCGLQTSACSVAVKCSLQTAELVQSFLSEYSVTSNIKLFSLIRVK